MKRLLLFASLALALITTVASAQTPTKKVLLEEFTGSWCGWCPRGIYAIQQLEAKYPNSFIPVSFHNSDPMQISTGQDTLESTVTGYPDGWIDRLAHSRTEHVISIRFNGIAQLLRILPTRFKPVSPLQTLRLTR
jgi:hypothetical protein